MGAHWFYVENDDKVGPVDQNKIVSLIKERKLSSSSYVWTAGFENWKRLFEVESLSLYLSENNRESNNIFDWRHVNPEEKKFFIMIGKDRGANKETLYGPYSMKTIGVLYKESRVNGRSYIWCSGMQNWKILADIEIFEKSFGETPPEIEEIERRSGSRRPFIARMLFHNDSQLYEGICRDISLGGMQVLVSGFPAQLGEHISLNVHPDNSEYHFVASGEVVRVLEGRQGFSFRFIEVSDQARSAISKYIDGEL